MSGGFNDLLFHGTAVKLRARPDWIRASYVADACVSAIMSEGKLRTAILGLNEGGQLLLEAAGRVDCLQIEAVADKDPNLVERIGGEHRCAAFDDYRQLVMQNDLDCLLVAEAMHSCEEYVRVAMKKKLLFMNIGMSPGSSMKALGMKYTSQTMDTKKMPSQRVNGIMMPKPRMGRFIPA